MKFRLREISWQVFVGLILLTSSLSVFSYSCLLGSSSLVEWEVAKLLSVKFLFQLYLDKHSLIFVSTVLVICSSVMFFTSNYMDGDPMVSYITLIILLFVGSMVYLILSPNMVLLMLGWDGLGLTSYLLVIYYMNHKSVSAGMITIMTNRIGDVLLMLACALSYMGGHFNFTFSNYNSIVFFGSLLVVGAMTKSAQFPFSAWLPAAMAAPTPVSALVHSSTLVTAGVYLLIRFYPSLCDYAYISNFLLMVGVSTCLLAGLSAIYEMDLKKMVALSTMSQLGVMVLSLGLGQPNIAYFHLISHALMKALLFICAGSIIHSMSNNQDIRLMGGLSLHMPLTSSVLNVSNLALCGFPFLSGFYSKDIVVEFFFGESVPFFTGTMLLFSVVFTSAYMMRLSLLSLWAPFKGGPLKSVNDESGLIKLSYTVLIMGTIFGVPTALWVVKPMVMPMIMPTIMKMCTLMLVLSMGASGLYLSSLNLFGPGNSIMSSLWYLNSISSYPLSFQAYKANSFTMYSEVSWMEYPWNLFLGKLNFFFQKIFNISVFTGLKSFFFWGLVLLLVSVKVYYK